MELFLEYEWEPCILLLIGHILILGKELNPNKLLICY